MENLKMVDSKREEVLAALFERQLWARLPSGYKSIIDGKRFALMLADNGATALAPISKIMSEHKKEIESTKKIVFLECCVCGNETRGRQWSNRDTGYGVCERCAAEELETISTDKDMKNFVRMYGYTGLHHAL